MKRREFLQAIGLLLVSGKVAVDSLIKYNESETRKDIYKLGDYVYLADYETTDKDGNKNKSQGCGICLDDYFITVDHIPSSTEKNRIHTPLGIIETGIDIKSKKASINELEMEEVIRNPKKDIAIYRLNKNKMAEHGLEPFPCKPSSRRNLGDKVYIIGNPQLKGFNIRETTISDLDGLDLMFGDIEMKHEFGIGKRIIPGDSGSPLINEDYKLIGLSNVYFEQVGYAVKIEEFLKELDGKSIGN
jgi:S1-C subfamily serine protease